MLFSLDLMLVSLSAPIETVVKLLVPFSIFLVVITEGTIRAFEIAKKTPLFLTKHKDKFRLLAILFLIYTFIQIFQVMSPNLKNRIRTKTSLFTINEIIEDNKLDPENAALVSFLNPNSFKVALTGHQSFWGNQWDKGTVVELQSKKIFSVSAPTSFTLFGLTWAANERLEVHMPKFSYTVVGTLNQDSLFAGKKLIAKCKTRVTFDKNKVPLTSEQKCN